jgi:Arc/MetJ-type ribon-helix-helix transcriptional regulator
MATKDPLISFNTRLPLSLVTAIEDRIKETGETKTEILRAALRLYLGMDKPEKKGKAASK